MTTHRLEGVVNQGAISRWRKLGGVFSSSYHRSFSQVSPWRGAVTLQCKNFVWQHITGFSMMFGRHENDERPEPGMNAYFGFGKRGMGILMNELHNKSSDFMHPFSNFMEPIGIVFWKL